MYPVFQYPYLQWAGSLCWCDIAGFRVEEVFVEDPCSWDHSLLIVPLWVGAHCSSWLTTAEYESYNEWDEADHQCAAVLGECAL